MKKSHKRKGKGGRPPSKAAHAARRQAAPRETPSPTSTRPARPAARSDGRRPPITAGTPRATTVALYSADDVRLFGLLMAPVALFAMALSLVELQRPARAFPELLARAPVSAPAPVSPERVRSPDLGATATAAAERQPVRVPLRPATETPRPMAETAAEARALAPPVSAATDISASQTPEPTRDAGPDALVAPARQSPPAATAVEARKLALAPPRTVPPPAASVAASPPVETVAPVAVTLALPPAGPPKSVAALTEGEAQQCAAPERPPLSRVAARPTFTPDTDPEQFGLRLAEAARRQVDEFVIYNDKYASLAYPMGDVSPFYGVCTDVLIRAYRDLGLDLQELVHKARVGSGDTNIDHRRVDTLRKFFSVYGEKLPISQFAEDYRPGDVVSYYRPQNAHSRTHIALVSDIVGPSGRLMIIHNRGWGPQLEDALFVDEITGHYRYAGARQPGASPAVPVAKPLERGKSKPTAVVKTSLKRERPGGVPTPLANPGLN